MMAIQWYQFGLQVLYPKKLKKSNKDTNKKTKKMTKVTKILWWILGGGKGSGKP
jgi:hypothetical protein